MALFQKLRISLLFAIAIAIFASTDACATVYDFTIAHADPYNCYVFGAFHGCDSIFAGLVPGSANAGDEYDYHVTFDSPVHVSGSSIENFVFVEVYDTKTNNFTPSSGPFAFTTTLNMIGYVGPSGPLVGPATVTNEDQFFAVGGFFGVPNAGFSLTGFDAKIQVLTTDPNALLGTLIGADSIPPAPAVPEPITLSLFGAGLAGAFAIRRRKKQLT